MNRDEMKRHLREKVQRQKAFFARKELGGLLAYVDRVPVEDEKKDSDDLRNSPGLAGYVYRAVIAADGSIAPDQAAVEMAVEDFVRRHRAEVERAASPASDDSIPCVYAHWDIGWHTAVMVGLPPSFSRGSWWLEPNLNWDTIEALRFNPNNPWLVVARYTHLALWKHWA